MPVRTVIPLAALLALAFGLALPAGAVAQGAGDDQYQDPFGEEQAQPEPTAAPAPAPTQAPSQAAPAPTATPAPAAPAAPAASPPPASGGGQLPYTGANAGLLALAGAALLGAGVALRRRADPRR